MEDVGELLSSAVGLLVQGFLSAARWVYVWGRRPGYDWTTGRRSGRAYRATWQIGRVVFWVPVVIVLAGLVYLVYFA